MKRSAKALAWLGVVAVSVAAGAIGIGYFGAADGDVVDDPYAANAASDTETVTVERRDITAVVSVQAVVTANAQFDVVATRSGVVDFVFAPKDTEVEQRVSRPGGDPDRRTGTSDDALSTTAGPATAGPTGPALRLDPTDPPTEPGDPTDPGEPGEPGEPEDGTTTPSPDPGDGPDPGEEDPTEEPEPTEPDPAGEPVDQGTPLWTVDGKTVKSPVDAGFVEWLVADGAKVKKGVPVARLSYPGFALVGTLPATDAYRLLDGELTATGGITDGPSGFDCTLLQAPPAAAEAETVAPQVVCALDDDVRAFPDLDARLALHSGQVTDVLTLPVTAVSGSAEQGEVTVVAEDGSTEVRTVGLGATDGAVVEIVSGLAEGDTVRATPPSLVR